MINKILKITFISWVALWVAFTARELFLKGNLEAYARLLPMTLDEKRAYVTGEELYAFLVSCAKQMPAGATYKISGLEDDSIDYRRAVYYLYPHLESEQPEFLIDTLTHTLKKRGE